MDAQHICAPYEIPGLYLGNAAIRASAEEFAALGEPFFFDRMVRGVIRRQSSGRLICECESHRDVRKITGL